MTTVKLELTIAEARALESILGKAARGQALSVGMYFDSPRPDEELFQAALVLLAKTKDGIQNRYDEIVAPVVSTDIDTAGESLVDCGYPV